MPLRQELLTGIPYNYQGKLFSVNWTIDMRVKHDAWNEFGKGHKMQLPISIVPQFVVMQPQMVPAQEQMMVVQPQLMPVQPQMAPVQQQVFAAQEQSDTKK